ncbi:MAG TPA: DUF1292 domain-containing protein [Oculatellaceae cyanobacterium]|jgi:hypothetical protein
MSENGRFDEEFYRETDIVETTDEDGTVHIFEKLQELEVDGQDYALLIYKGNEYKEEAPEDEEEEVVVMRLSYEDGQEVFEAIEDEEEFERVVSYIENMEEDEEGEISVDVGELLAQMAEGDENPLGESEKN